MIAMKPYTKEFGRNFRLALPIILGQLGHVFVGLVDNIMVGVLGAAPLAAISLGNAFIFIAMSIGIGFSYGLTPLIAEADGQDNSEKGRAFFQTAVWLCTLLGILLYAVLYWTQPVLELMNQPREVVVLAKPYLHIVAASLIPLMIFQSFKQCADGLSRTQYAMYATIFANILNVILNYLLIYGIWIFPRLELEGAAIGTLISRIFMVIFMWFLIQNRPKFKPYLRWDFNSWMRKDRIRTILQLGFPTSLQMFFEVAIFSATIFLAGMLGTESQAANQITLNLASMTFMVAAGLGVAATIRVGNQKGKQDIPNLKRIARSVFLLVLLIEILFALVFVSSRSLLPRFYIQDSVIQGIAAQLLLIAAWFQVSDGLQVTILGALRGLQDVRIPTWICFFAYWVIGFPVCYLLGIYLNYGVAGIWWGLLIALSVSAGLLYLRFTYLSNRLLSAKNKE